MSMTESPVTFTRAASIVIHPPDAAYHGFTTLKYRVTLTVFPLHVRSLMVTTESLRSIPPESPGAVLSLNFEETISATPISSKLIAPDLSPHLFSTKSQSSM